MESTTKMDLKKATLATFYNDDIKETIIEYGNNFQKIENYLTNTTNNPENLSNGQVYKKGKIIYNDNPTINGYIGWVNVREGVHVPYWQPRKEYSVGEKIKPSPNNGYYYECVVAGKSMVKSPLFLTGANQEFYDANGTNWIKNYYYQVDDVVFSTDGSKLYYYICETAGLSGVTEPVWSSVANGTTVIDGSVVWRKAKTVRWKLKGISAEFRPFGKIE